MKLYTRKWIEARRNEVTIPQSLMKGDQDHARRARFCLRPRLAAVRDLSFSPPLYRVGVFPRPRPPFADTC